MRSSKLFAKKLTVRSAVLDVSAVASSRRWSLVCRCGEFCQRVRNFTADVSFPWLQLAKSCCCTAATDDDGGDEKDDSNGPVAAGLGVTVLGAMTGGAPTAATSTVGPLLSLPLAGGVATGVPFCAGEAAHEASISSACLASKGVSYPMLCGLTLFSRCKSATTAPLTSSRRVFSLATTEVRSRATSRSL